MRETKCRAKGIMGPSDRWVYGDYFSQYKNSYTTHYIIEHPNGRDGGREAMSEIDAETLGQWTGLKDRNGTPIFEGDITTSGLFVFRTDLNYDSGGAKHSGFWFDPVGDGNNGELSWSEAFDDCVVLGNRYESLELLESK